MSVSVTTLNFKCWSFLGILVGKQTCVEVQSHGHTWGVKWQFCVQPILVGHKCLLDRFLVEIYFIMSPPMKWGDILFLALLSVCLSVRHAFVSALHLLNPW